MLCIVRVALQKITLIILVLHCMTGFKEAVNIRPFALQYNNSIFEVQKL